MKLFRITRAKYAEDLTGEGSSRTGGRWNPRGIAALYTSKTISLALLEVLVHVQDRSLLPASYTVMEIEIDPEMLVSIDEVPEQEFKSQEIGESLLRNEDLIGFMVPSVLIPSEQNVILNPRAKNFKKVKLVRHFKLSIDARFR